MDFGLTWRRGLTGMAVGIAAGVVIIPGATAATATTCPKVSPAGVVTPAPAPGVDWSQCNLNGANLSGGDLSHANLNGSSLTRANLTGANLTGADIESAGLYATTMTGATLTGAVLTGSRPYLLVSGQITGTPAKFPANWSLADGYLIGPYDNLENADLAGANLARADLDNAMITKAHLAGANLTHANLGNSNLYGSDLSGANLTDTDLSTFYLENLTLTRANLSGTQFAYNSDLTGVVSGGITGTPANLPYYPDGRYVLGGGYLAGPAADLAGADLAGVNLTGAALVANANLSDANLTGANLSYGVFGADLSGTELAGADLSHIDSRGNTGTPASLPRHWAYVNGYLLGPTVEAIYANLSGDDLAGLDLAGGQFNYANLTKANLDGADLAQTYIDFANLTGATAAGANFAGASWYSTTCPNGTDSNIYIDGCFSPRDTTPPVLHLNVKNGQVFAVGMAPQVQCTATDKYTYITTQPTLKVTGHSAHGLGKFTATCSGAANLAGLVARPVSATYWVAYGFGGMEPGQGAVVPVNPRMLTVTFSLEPATGQLPAKTGRAMARGRDVRLTLRGPGIRAETVNCSYSSQSGFVCKLPLPRGIKTGRQHSYTLTAYENDGFGFVIAPGEPTAENPATIHFG